MAIGTSKFSVLLEAKLDTKTLDSQLKTLNTKGSGLGLPSAKTGATNLKSMAREAKGAKQGMTDILGKVAKFGAATAIIGGFTAALRGAFATILEFDKSLTEFKKVSDLSGEALDDYTKKLGELGGQVARTRSEMVDAAVEFKKAGFSEDESADLSLVATMFQNVADDEISAGEAAGFVTSQLKAFNIESENAIHIIDGLNEVSNNFAVSSSDVSTALSKTSAAMATLGNSYEETIGLVTAGTEIMQGQSKLYWTV